MNTKMEELEALITVAVASGTTSKGIAEAVIKALMKPTDAMIEAGMVHIGDHTEEHGGKRQDANHCYQDMLEVVLGGSG